MPGVVAFIPSPSSGRIGPLHMYGLVLAIGVLVAAWIAERRWVRAGHDAKQFSDIVVWIVVAGVLGARVYHLFTGYDWEREGWANALAIWKGGLSIWGAVGGGTLALVVLARRRRLDALALLDAIAPGLVVAQAIGRWGNWFNQELFGGPTKMPWGLEIDLGHRPAGYTGYKTFHPTFLYESLWCLTIFGVLLWAERRFRFRRGQTFALYIAMYTFGRFWFENLRIDKATELFGQRFNGLLSAALCVLAIVWFVLLGRRPQLVGAHPPDR